MPSSLLTKKIFADTLKRQMESTPFAKISIGDITKECGMNRNSFYYHFKDKYDLLNWIFTTEIAEVVSREEALDLSGWELFERICVCLYSSRVFYANAMNYEGQNSFLNYFEEMFAALLEARAEDLLKEDIDPEFREFYTEFFLSSIIMTIVRWIKDGAKYPPDRFIEMLKRAAAGLALRVLEDNETII